MRLTSALLACLAAVSALSTSGRSVEAAQAASAPSPATTLRSSWTLGSRVSLAAVLYDAGAPAEQVDKRIANARALGLLLGVTIPPLPPRTGDKAKDSAAVLAYVLKGVGEPAMKVLGEQHTAVHARVYELAAKSNLLLMLYAPGDSLAKTIADVIERNGAFAKLPAPLWKPVVDLVRKDGAFNDVRDAVFKMHGDIDAYLAAAR